MNKVQVFLMGVSLFVLGSLLLINPLDFNNQFFAYGVYSAILIALLVLSLKIQPNIDKNIHDNQTSLDNVDLVKWICAIIIIILHLRPFQTINPILDTVFNNMISRICVPFFFISSGYLAAKKIQNEPNYIHRYIKQTLKTYIKVSIIYLPLGIAYLLPAFGLIQEYIESFGFNSVINGLIWCLLIIIGLLIAFFYVGTYYHLWYFPALLISLAIIDWVRKRFKLSILLIISFFLLIIGSFETYYGSLPVLMQWFLDKYFMVFITTRNFLFFGLFYVTLGYLIYGKKPLFARNALFGLLLSAIGLVVETVFLQTITRLDSNILISAAPFVYFLFIVAIYSNQWTRKKINFRAYSIEYYLWHPMIIFFMIDIFHLNIIWANEPYLLVLLGFLLTHLLSTLLISLRNRKRV